MSASRHSSIPLPQILDLGVAETLHKTLAEYGKTKSKLRIDGTSVERATTPCVQILVAAGKSAEAQGQEVSYRLSDHLREVVNELGLGPIFDLWERANG